MEVKLIAHTRLARVDGLYDYVIADYMEPDESATNIDTLAEFGGRSCYQSFGKPNPATRENEDYLANILRQAHESVLEHASVTFYVTGVSRALTHELIRHRHLSFSELSQRFVNVEDAEVVIPPALQESTLGIYLDEHVEASSKAAYKFLVGRLEEKGLPRKQAREAARAVMPNATETRIVVTGNIRAWRDVLKKRWHEAADAEIRRFAGEVLRQLREVAPHSLQDIPDEPYSYD